MALLSQTAEYALRAMSTLASLGPGETLRAQDLAERTGIPVHYLSKIMRRLVLQRLVAGRKGHGGGFCLRRPPGDITFHDVLEAVDADRRPNACVFGWAACDDRNPCPLHPAWTGLKAQFQDWAAHTTMADVPALRTASTREPPPARKRRPRKT